MLNHMVSARESLVANTITARNTARVLRRADAMDGELMTYEICKAGKVS